MFRRALRKGIDRLVFRVTAVLTAAPLIGGVGLAGPAAAQVSDQPPAVSAYERDLMRPDCHS
jgi:hypothetical protein